MDQVPIQPPKIHDRFAYRLGARLPKVLRIMYYIVLFMTFIYFIYRFFEWFLKTFQKIGAFAFDPRNYWAGVMAFGILLIGGFILAQFILGLDPVGKTIDWIENSIKLLEMRYL
jgi:TRAP-type C4-dicarboxylate transport system permease small subunit